MGIIDDVSRSERKVPFLNDPRYFVHDTAAAETQPLDKKEIERLFNEEEQDEEDYEDDDADEDVFPNKPRRRTETEGETKAGKEDKDKDRIKEEIEESFIDKNGTKLAIGGVVALFFFMIVYVLANRGNNKNLELSLPLMLNEWNTNNNHRYDYLVECITNALKSKSPLEAQNDWMKYLRDNGLENKEYDTMFANGKVKLANIGIHENWKVIRDLMGNPVQVHKISEAIR